jgi:NAD(P)-dependent dehydrogenase (short-subunit alcohol dehydrogenase family)
MWEYAAQLPSWTIKEEDWDRHIATNLKCTFLDGQAVAREMAKRG